MTQFGRHPDRNLKDLGREAIEGAVGDAGIDPDEIEAVYFANALAGLTVGQECIRGQTVLHAMGWGGLPVVNVENACASAGTALNLAWSAVAGGQYRTVLAVGVEKMFIPGDRQRPFVALNGAMDVERPHSTEEGAGADRSSFMDLYAKRARSLMADRGVTEAGLARLAVKAWHNGSLNPLAQHGRDLTVDQVLGSRMVVAPLTLLMCSSIGDGAAAAVVTSGRGHHVEIRASQVRMLAAGENGTPSATLAARAAFEQAGLGPDDLDLAEVHDATTAGEMVSWGGLMLCPPGDEEKWAQTGHTELGGQLPINPSGGLVARGHPVGASGLGQVHEVVTQLRGRAERRQVDQPRVALCHVGGGSIGTQTATAAVHILSRP
jgi:acetyl-CoA acetyltransferase